MDMWHVDRIFTDLRIFPFISSLNYFSHGFVLQYSHEWEFKCLARRWLTSLSHGFTQATSVEENTVQCSLQLWEFIEVCHTGGIADPELIWAGDGSTSTQWTRAVVRQYVDGSDQMKYNYNRSGRQHRTGSYIGLNSSQGPQNTKQLETVLDSSLRTPGVVRENT